MRFKLQQKRRFSLNSDMNFGLFLTENVSSMASEDWTIFILLACFFETERNCPHLLSFYEKEHPGHSAKNLLFGSTEESKSFGFGMT